MTRPKNGGFFIKQHLIYPLQNKQEG
jgi:hypothetical protein